MFLLRETTFRDILGLIQIILVLRDIVLEDSRTNYIITHTDKFKAAISGSGMSNLIGDVYDVWNNIGPVKSLLSIL